MASIMFDTLQRTSLRQRALESGVRALRHGHGLWVQKEHQDSPVFKLEKKELLMLDIISCGFCTGLDGDLSHAKNKFLARVPTSTFPSLRNLIFNNSPRPWIIHE